MFIDGTLEYLKMSIFLKLIQYYIDSNVTEFLMEIDWQVASKLHMEEQRAEKTKHYS